MLKKEERDKKIVLLEKRIENFKKHLTSCTLCPRKCQVNRKKGERGYCGEDEKVTVFTAFLHKGEEPPLVGCRGSGTIFFSGCNLKCIYCQNFRFSHNLEGEKITIEQLSKIMLNLQEKGAVNINLVTPTHFLPQILSALLIAMKKGLELPIVYNSSGYERIDILKYLEGIIDIYLPDMKYYSQKVAELGSNTPDYPIHNREAILEMYRQMPESIWTSDNILKKGLIVRHLVLPNFTCESYRIIKWLEKNTPTALISIMFQYRPYFQAKNHPILGRRLTFFEYKEVKSWIEESSLEGWIQDFCPPDSLAGVYFSPLENI